MPASNYSLHQLYSPDRLALEAHGFKAWTYDPVNATGSYVLATSGTVYVAKVPIPGSVPFSVSNIHTVIKTAGGTLTAGQCFAGLIQDGTLLASTADQASAWASTGLKTMALSSAQTVYPGWAYVGLLFNGTTGPQLPMGNSGSVIAAGSGPDYRWATADTARTTMPSTLGTRTALNSSFWVALS